MGKTRVISLIFLFAALAWMVMIFCFSAQTADDSSDLSSGLLVGILRGIVPHWEARSATEQLEILDKFHTIFRKFAHFTEYGILGILWTMSTRSGYWEKKSCKAWRIVLPFCICLLNAVSDEIHQLFVEGRSGEFRDVCIDFSGACTGILLLTFFVFLLRKNHNKRKQSC